MSVKGKALRYVDAKSKDTVFGFTRNISKTYNYNIPIVITNITLLYYFENDNWDKTLVGDFMHIDEHNCLTHKGDVSGTAFLTKEFDSGVHSWRFKIEKVCDYGKNDWTTTIGIFDATENMSIACNDVFVRYGIGFGYQMGHIVNCDADDFTEYGIRCKKGDIIEMIVDCDKQELKYIINGVDYGKAFDIDKKKYRAAVNLWAKGDAIRLL
eukprot:64017_1